jgi:hypothetical protein
VLNAGALRVLPRISNIPTLHKSTSTVFALSGIESGKMIAASKQSGRIFNLPAGYYRIKTRYENSNVEAVTDVRIKPGVMSALDVDHLAGVARLSFVGHRGDDVQWTITSDSGEALPLVTGAEADLVLKPGKYYAEATAGSVSKLTEFEIRDGEEREIVLGN